MYVMGGCLWVQNRRRIPFDQFANGRWDEYAWHIGERRSWVRTALTRRLKVARSADTALSLVDPGRPPSLSALSPLPATFATRSTKLSGESCEPGPPFLYGSPRPRGFVISIVTWLGDRLCT